MPRIRPAASFGSGLQGVDMKAAPRRLFFTHPRSGAAHIPAWQISAGCLALSHHHSSPREPHAATHAYVVG